jgi:hypothetical protein
MWKELIQNLWLDASFYPSAAAKDILTAESQLGLLFPTELKELLGETDGVNASHSTSYIFRTSPQANPYDCFVEQNSTMRSTPDFAELYAPFDNILFIGADGGGGLFGYEIKDSQCTSNIIYWEHEDDSRIRISTSGIEGYLKYAAAMYSN